MEITINETLVPILEQKAEDNHMTAEEYAVHIIESHLKSQYRETLINKIKMSPIEDVKAYTEVVAVKSAEIEAAKPKVIIDEITGEIAPVK